MTTVAPAPAARAPPGPLPLALPGGDDVEVDRTRQPLHPVDDRAVEQLLERRPLAGAEHELGGVLGPGEVDEGRGGVGPGDLVVGAAHSTSDLVGAYHE